MELAAFFAIVFGGVIFVLWWSRRSNNVEVDSPIQGLPDDLRDKNPGMEGLPNRGRPPGGGP